MRWAVTTTSPVPYPQFHLMTKAVGAICNLDCVYCYYLEKEQLYTPGKASRFRMDDAVLESYVRQYIESQAGNEVTFSWQGGEPTLLGVAFYERALELQRRHSGGRTIHNTIQTNGTLIDDAWAAFFKRHHFLVGISVDGPPEVHDAYRTDKGGAPTHGRVMRGLDVLRRHGVEYNILTTVNARNVADPLGLYRYLKTLGSPFIQFIPVVERPDPARPEVTAHTVPAEAFGEFLCRIYDEWVRQDVGRVFVQYFDSALASYMGMGGSMCVFAPTCGGALALEHNGDVYSCDHFVYPEYLLGNLMELPLADLVRSGAQVTFGQAKLTDLPPDCQGCDVRFACHGDCPKHRFTPESGVSYLCPAYRRFFRHVAPTMRYMANELRHRRSPAGVMWELRQQEERAAVPQSGPDALARRSSP